MTHTRIIVSRYGGPETLQAIQEPIPEPPPDHVRIKVLAAGVALPDVMMREGFHPEKPSLPFTPGWDLVGLVDRVAPNVSAVQNGQTVAALPIIGAYTQYICLPPARARPRSA